MDIAGQIHKSIMKSILSYTPIRQTENGLNEILNNYPYSFQQFCKLLTIPIKQNGELKGYNVFNFNSSQEMVNNFFLNQYENLKKNNFVITKYRQNGVSTLATALGLFAGLSNNYNVAFVGKDESNTKNLYNMVANYVENLKPYGVTIGVGKNGSEVLPVCFGNKKFFIYFRVATGMGVRGLTLGCLIDDELGHRKSVDEGGSEALASGVNSIKLGIGTPCGTDNDLYVSFKNGVAGKNILFIPWHRMKECERLEEIEIASDVEEYFKKYQLDFLPKEKKYWFAEKWENLRLESFNLENRFNQEYPPNLYVGFESSASDVFCNTDFIYHAFKNKQAKRFNQCILGIDVAGNGASSDKFVVCVRFGNVAEFITIKSNPNDYDYRVNRSQQIFTWILKNQIQVNRINIDTGGIGKEFIGVFTTFLRKNGCNIPVQSINFGEKVEMDIRAFEVQKMGMRDFMYFRMREWLSTKDVAIQDILELKEELLATKTTSRNGVETLISKEEISSNIKRSPDYADALALTFAPNKGLQLSGQIINNK